MVEEKAVSTEPKPYRFSVEEFLKLSNTGFFDQQNRLQLVHGEIIEVGVMGPNHVNALTRLDRRLQRFQSEVLVSQQCPLVLPESVPFPDIALLKLPEDQYAGRLPTPGDVLLIIEVSETSLAYDRKVKLALYAQAGIQEYWIVNLVDNQLEVYRDPKGADYLTRNTYQPGASVQALALSEAVNWD